MPIETLEALRLLTNLETEKRKLLQVVIFGQPELEDKLNHPSIRQLKQRITFNYHLGSLSHNEIAHYLQHRLKVAGYKGEKLFTRAALWLMQYKTKRVPRLVNIVAHKAMLSTLGKGRQVVGVLDVLTAINDTASLHGAYRLEMRGVALLILIACGIGWMHIK